MVDRRADARNGAIAPDWANYRAVAWARKQRVGSAGAKYVLVALATFANSDGTCYPAQSTLAGIIELAERTVRRHLRYLKNRGLITRTRRGKADGTRNSDLYKLAGAPFMPAAKLAGSQSEQPANLNQQPAAKLAGDQKERLKTFNVKVLQKSQAGADTRNTRSPSNEDIVREAVLVDEVMAVCGDPQSLPYYRKVAHRVREETVRAALSETRLAKHEGRINKTVGAFFVDELKLLVRERGEGELSELIGRLQQ